MAKVKKKKSTDGRTKQTASAATSGRRKAIVTKKLTRVGNATGILLPKEILAKLRVAEGDLVHLVETPRGVELTPYDPEFEAQMEVAERVMREDRDVLRRLAE